MASIKFTKDTVQDAMELIDENKDKISENQYIQMCNMLKFVHLNSGIDKSSIINNYIENQMYVFHCRHEKLLKEYNKLKPPCINNHIRNQAYWVIANKLNLITSHTSVSLKKKYHLIDGKMKIKRDSPLDLILYTNYYLQNHEKEIIKLYSIISPDSDYCINNTISTCYINYFKSFLLENGSSEKEIKDSIRYVVNIRHQSIKERYLKEYFTPFNNEIIALTKLKEDINGF